MDGFVSNTGESIWPCLLLEHEKIGNEMKEKKCITVKAKIEELEKISAFAERLLDEEDLDERVKGHFLISLDELFSNVAFYSKAETVRIKYIRNQAGISFCIFDDGAQYDPTKAEEPDTASSAEERDIGGLGIHIVRNLMDKIDYKYNGIWNITTISKNI